MVLRACIGEDALIGYVSIRQHTSAYVSVCMVLRACIGEDALIGAAGVLHELG
jgi:UDP-3-O-[3-hydroxymyristoyl] glucosamine N-acyltransferase